MKFTSDKTRGFTLIEVSMVILIVGILFVPLIKLYEINRKQQQLAREKENIADASSALSKYVLENSKYPCPARNDLAPNDPNYGKEYCPIATNPIPGNCDGDKICRSVGRDRHTASAGGDPILVGFIPFAELGLGVKNVIDRQGNKLTYAVSERLTNPTNFNNYHGAITVTAENGTSLTGNATDPGAHFVVFSHGENSKGAYSAIGQNVSACSGAGLDNENCDNDGTFIQGLLALGTGAAYFDDLLQYRTTLSSGLWSLTGGGSNNIMNTNVGNIGIGTSSPAEKLDVNGNIRVTGKTISGQICDTTGTNCFDPIKLGGNAANASRINCPAGQIIQGFASGAGTCVTPSFASSIPTQSCPAATPYMRGLNSDGTIICGN